MKSGVVRSVESGGGMAAANACNGISNGGKKGIPQNFISQLAAYRMRSYCRVMAI